MSEPLKRTGRLPSLYKEEVDAIRASYEGGEHDTQVLALRWSLSVNTIRRVLGLGRWADMPYIARDELNDSARYDSDGNSLVMKDYDRTGHKRGRPFLNRAEEMTAEEKELIAADTRATADVAAAFGISRSYVYRIKQAYGVKSNRRAPMSMDTRRAIRADERPIGQIARAYKLPMVVVELIKADRTIA